MREGSGVEQNKLASVCCFTIAAAYENHLAKNNLQLFNLTQHEQEIVDAVCSEGSEERKHEALEWLCAQHYAEVELLLRRRASYHVLIELVNNTLPMPIAEEVVLHVATLN